MTPWQLRRAFPGERSAGDYRKRGASEHAMSGNSQFAIEAELSLFKFVAGANRARSSAGNCLRRWRMGYAAAQWCLIYLCLADRGSGIVADPSLQTKVTERSGRRFLQLQQTAPAGNYQQAMTVQ